MPFTTEFEFVLPKGYVDRDGNLCKKGTMRLATAADEIVPRKDPRVKDNDEYLAIILLARVVTSLENVKIVDTHIIENLFKKDFDYLLEFYQSINESDKPVISAMCPECNGKFQVETSSLGEWQV